MKPSIFRFLARWQRARRSGTAELVGWEMLRRFDCGHLEPSGHYSTSRRFHGIHLGTRGPCSACRTSPALSTSPLALRPP